ncbi:hypothetical protein DH2020_004438 [Rehmannia glutinosa]|uniref:Uncharacterized protein n=1 Tax=Rehmannia glutinosa TaxID=99300 RepID=A0ABR0XPF5_REHGL
MSVGDSLPPPPPPALDGMPFELKDESDFDQLISDGFVSICGFGSLLSGSLAKLSGFRRVFAHAAPIFFQLGIAKPGTKEISRLSLEPCEGESLLVTTFQIMRSEVTLETHNGLFHTSPVVLCACYRDEEYFLHRCKGSKEIFYQRFGRYGIHKIWLDDILPCRVYLRHCVLAAENLHEIAYNDLMDHTFLGDRKTTIREYLATKGSGIMEEEPPQHLKYLYGG